LTLFTAWMAGLNPAMEKKALGKPSAFSLQQIPKTYDGF